MPASSATDAATPPGRGEEAGEAAGRTFAEALGTSDRRAMLAVLHPDIDFCGLTPRATWPASGAHAVLDDVLARWFEPSDEIDEILAIETDAICDRHRVAYRFRVHNPDGQFVVEQQAYYTARDGQIDWMRVLCSGFRPV